MMGEKMNTFLVVLSLILIIVCWVVVTNYVDARLDAMEKKLVLLDHKPNTTREVTNVFNVEKMYTEEARIDLGFNSLLWHWDKRNSW
jgi:hypothetical protein